MSLMIMGLVFVILAVLFALPFFGIGRFIPVDGDLIDIALSIILFAAGTIILFRAGVVNAMSSLWWMAIVAIALYVFILVIKSEVAQRA